MSNFALGRFVRMVLVGVLTFVLSQYVLATQLTVAPDARLLISTIIAGLVMVYARKHT